MALRTYFYSGIAALGLGLFFTSCNNGKEVKQENVETTQKGSISITVDESFKPVIEQELKVFDSSFPEATIRVQYKPENQCIEDLFKDSARLILTTRDITPQEKQTMLNNGVKVRSMQVAMDAIAVIVHPGSADSLMTLGQLRSILLGTFTRPYTIVFDNQQSGTVRYMMDSLIPGQKLSSKSYAVKDNESVIKYVSENEGSLGIVGVSHVYDPEDTDVNSVGVFRKGIRVVSLMDDSTGRFYEPYQAYIALKKYPLRRSLYFISRESWQGLGTGFINFLCSEPGQLIFSKARLVPLRVQLRIREAEIKP
jgi:phosphate transport system substrate-binding protein